MKKIFNIIICTLFLFLLFSCEDRNNTILIYSCTEDYKNEFYLNELKKQFPSYDFILDYQGSGAAAAKLKAEGLDTQADILLSWEYTYFDMLKDYLVDLSEFDTSMYLSDMLPTSKKYLPECRNSGAIVINTELLNEKGIKEPTSYQDLLKPEFNGLLSMPNPSSSGTGYMFLKNLVNEWGEDNAFSYFDKLSENILQFTSSGSGPINALVQKEAAVALGMTAQAVTMINQGAPLKILFFEEGVPFSQYGHAITKKAEKRKDYKQIKEVFNYLVYNLTPKCDALYFPEQVFVDKVFSLKNYPSNIPYGDMSNNTIEEKQRLLEKWLY